ncbi:signal recognition particle-docking protein FtsY [Chelativorans sp. SCAU2101]|uniref:Signal recognition particle receptor FtsY n=1 Tax=Chelativorans petroleitrophicus TaxID=2975484 RepID=A0A9X2X672_9HYPH|nr:signal recognition particle-docking protein FtsY [Chelativorans petroleitrophicus]MCT8988951.1 signal recognition particle-docking protein FtsY [Chelativorans petroleitrophicus]
MAFGFIKKVFSFGKKEVEERPAEAGGEASPAELTRGTAPQPSEPKPEPEVPPQPEPPARPEEPEPQPQPPAPQPEVPPEAPQEPEIPEPSPAPAPEIPETPQPSAVTPPRGEEEEQPEPVEVELPLAADGQEAAEAFFQPAETVEEAGEGQFTTSGPLPVKEELAPPKSAQAEGGETDAAASAPEALAEALHAGRVAVTRSVERIAEKAPAPAVEEPRKPWFQRLREGLSRSSRELRDSISGIFLKRKLDEETLEDLEDVLLRADLGLETAMRITDALAAGRYGKDISGAEVQAVMAEEIEKVLAPVAMPLELDLSMKPHVILVVGVNGTGKTTTIGKLAAKLRAGGLSVMLAAGDTFRAAAIEQLKIWGERTGSPVVSSKLGADAAGLAYEAYEKAKAAGSDVLIIDTAGRLQNKTELMAELEKIVRVLRKHDPEAPHTVLQTLDATTGQNALNQVEIFRNVAGVSGLVMTKLDGTARGGILVAIAARHKLPVYFIGVGEGVDDLEPFSASDFAKAIAGVA